jgi:hypothetical protein
MQKTIKLDIPIELLPFEAGEGFSATVENGVAHVLVKANTESMPASLEGAESLSMNDWIAFVKSLPKKEEISDEELKDERFKDLMNKHAPGYLEEHAS